MPAPTPLPAIRPSSGVKPPRHRPRPWACHSGTVRNCWAAGGAHPRRPRPPPPTAGAATDPRPDAGQPLPEPALALRRSTGLGRLIRVVLGQQAPRGAWPPSAPSSAGSTTPAWAGPQGRAVPRRRRACRVGPRRLAGAMPRNFVRLRSGQQVLANGSSMSVAAPSCGRRFFPPRKLAERSRLRTSRRELRRALPRWGLPANDSGGQWPGPGVPRHLPPELALWLLAWGVTFIGNKSPHAAAEWGRSNAKGDGPAWATPEQCASVAELQQRSDDGPHSREALPSTRRSEAGRPAFPAWPLGADVQRGVGAVGTGTAPSRLEHLAGVRGAAAGGQERRRVAVPSGPITVGCMPGGSRSVSWWTRNVLMGVHGRAGAALRSQPAAELAAGRIRGLTVTSAAEGPAGGLGRHPPRGGPGPPPRRSAGGCPGRRGARHPPLRARPKGRQQSSGAPKLMSH